MRHPNAVSICDVFCHWCTWTKQMKEKVVARETHGSMSSLLTCVILTSMYSNNYNIYVHINKFFVIDEAESYILWTKQKHHRPLPWWSSTLLHTPSLWWRLVQDDVRCGFLLVQHFTLSSYQPGSYFKQLLVYDSDTVQVTYLDYY